MDWKVLTSAFVAVFFAEMADKTQLVGIGLASKTAKPLVVFIGSVSAYAVITAFSVLIGASLGKYINPIYIRVGGGAIFMILGALMLSGKI